MTFMGATSSMSQKGTETRPLGVPAEHTKVISAFDMDISFYLPVGMEHLQREVHDGGTFFRQDMLAEITALLPEQPTVVDLGANTGNYSLFWGLVADARVISIEPNPQAIAILKKNIELNDLEGRIECHELSPARRSGSDRANDGAVRDHSGAHLEGEQADLATLDEIIGDWQVDLIKLGSAGLDETLLTGAKSVLTRCNPILMAEAASLEDLRRIEQLLRPLGYQKTRRFTDATSVFLFQKGLESLPDGRGYTAALLDCVHDKLPPTQGIYAGLATSVGNEAALRASVMSLLPQVDGLFVYLNGVSDVPAFLTQFDKITYYLDQEGTRYGESAKFWGLQHVQKSVYFTCDDSIIYPVDFSERMLQELAQTGGKGIVAVHGSLLQYPVEDYHGVGVRSVFQCADALVRRRVIHVPGTEACAFHSDTVQITLDDFASSSMADIALATYAEEHRIPRYAIPRRAAWLMGAKGARQNTGRRSPQQKNDSCQNAEFQRVPPLSVATQGEDIRVLLVNLEKDSNIISTLNALRPGTRDPVVFLICDSITDKLRTMISQHKSNWEVHLMSRHDPFPAYCREILASNKTRLDYLEVKKGRMDTMAMPEDVENWLTASPRSPS